MPGARSELTPETNKATVPHPGEPGVWLGPPGQSQGTWASSKRVSGPDILLTLVMQTLSVRPLSGLQGWHSTERGREEAQEKRGMVPLERDRADLTHTQAPKAGPREAKPV